MKINCVIVDDEALARKGLEKYVNEIEFLSLKGVCKNAMEVNTILNNEKIDLLFLDIEMPMISGIDFLKSLNTTPKIIFTTAYSEYAVESFAFDVVDYLIKPISLERFLQASNKAYKQITKENIPKSTSLKSLEKEDDEFIFVKTEKQLARVRLDDILYVESMQNYIRIHCEKESHLILVPLKKIIEILPSNKFIQIHKSYIVSKSKVVAISGNQVVLGNTKIQIARSFKDEVIKSLTEDKILKK
ncbi:MAG TPA: LytTR family DNA-binding domain-containing protein [Cyclobacteriaceae bacterium]|nr:LytTR family DNA-binding domain-containing protein [Cyclobacteriaceae bacterium]HRK55372.1 LytTR family DNA-binding domain-containing protein [Cyclobacteriaceae bacterium]